MAKDEREQFKDDLWDAIVNVFYEYNGKRGTNFSKKEVDEVLEENARFFEEDLDDEDEDDYYYLDDDEDEGGIWSSIDNIETW